VHVALVGRGDVQGERAEQRPACLLEDGGAPAHVQPVPAVLHAHVRGEHPGLPGRPLQLDPDGVVADHPGVLLLDRDDDVAHERGGALRELQDDGFRAEIDGHGASCG
jgi:hypothetical protein